MNQNREKCSALSKKLINCIYFRLDNSKYCSYHQYFNNLTENQIEEIRKGEWKICTRCSKFFENKNDGNLKKCTTCINQINNYLNDRKKDSKCNWFDRNNKKCRNRFLKNSDYCKMHLYVGNYTEEQKKNSKKCSGCNMVKYFTEYNTCDECRNRKHNRQLNILILNKEHLIEENKNLIIQKYGANDKIVNIIFVKETDKNDIIKQIREKSNQDIIIKCAKENCIFKNSKDNNFCRKHQREFIIDKLKSENKKLCQGRKCKNILDIKYKSKCEKCLQKDRDNSKNIREKIIKDNRSILDNENILYDDKKICCIKCHKIKNILEFKNMRGLYGFKCTQCLEKEHVYIQIREPRNERYNIRDKLRDVKKSAKIRNISFELTDERVLELLKQKCIYCNLIPEKFTGIDRIDSKKGYTIENSFSCCKICNIMKYDYTLEDFIKFCRNIIDNFGNNELSRIKMKHQPYNKYKYDAKTRGKEFTITKDEFYKKLKYNCYYCNSTNLTDQIGLDRINSDIGYVSGNIVACCKICNYMKRNISIDDFLDRLKIIIDKLTIDKICKNPPKKITKEWLKNEFNKLKIYSDNSNIDKKYSIDNRNETKFLHEQNYYLNKIYNTIDITKFEPELEFCETAEQRDIWKYYRLKVSSFPNSKQKGRDIKILIRDKLTKKYVGIASLSSDQLFCYERDKYINWDYDIKINQKKINHIMNITTCISLPPFSYNFNGGKLIAMLMFSTEVYQYFKNKYNQELVGLLTFSLYGKSIQYDRLKQMKLIGYTQGYGSMHIPKKLYNYAIQYMDENGISHKNYSRRMYKLKKLSQHLELDFNIIHHGVERGIYFGWIGNRGRDFLLGETDNFEHDLITSVDLIGDEWKKRWAINRFNNKLKNRDILLYYTFNNIIDNIDIKNKNLKKFREKNQNYTDKLSDDNIMEIIEYYLNNKNISLNKLAIYFSEKFNRTIDHKKIRSIIYL